MKFCKKTLSFILAFMLMFSTFTPLSAMSDTGTQKTTIAGQELVIGDKVYYIFSTDKNAKSDLIKAQEKGKTQLEELEAPDGLEISGGLNQASVGAGQTEKAISYTFNIKGTNFIGVGGKTFDWDTLPDGLELQVFYIDEEGIDYNVGSPITINRTNYNEETTRTFDIAGEPIAFGMKTNVDSETYLTDVLLTNENSPEPGETSGNMTFDLVQVPSTNLSVKWVDVNKQPLARENTPSTILKNILTFNFIEKRTFDLPNQDKDESYFRLINKVKRVEVKDMQGATALVDGKKNGEEVTLDGKIYKLTTTYDPAFNKGSVIQLMYMPDVIDRTKNPDAETPQNYVRVTIDAGEGTKLAQDESKKIYDVRIGKALKKEHYPKLELKKGYKDPITWTIAPGTAITKAEDILGKADKTAAEKITAENLKAVDTTALQGQDLTEAFWHKGVALADTVPADKKDAFAALLKDATVTDITNPARTTAEAGDKVGTLLVTFKDGSTIEVPNQKLIVKPNTVTVAFDKAAGKEHPLRDGDTTVKGKITASSNSDQFPVSLDGAVVTIKKGDTVLSRTLANADGSFVAGVKEPLVAGEDISVVVTLPESKTESAPVTEKVQLNPDKLNEIIKTGNKVVGNFEGKKGVNQDLVKALKDAIKKATYDLVENDGKVKSTVTVDATGQKSLDDQYEAIKKAIEALTGNFAPEVKGTTSHKEIFKGDALNLEEGITVTDKDGETDIVKNGEKAFTYTVEKVDAKGNKTKVEDTTTIKDTAGTYEVTYTAKDKSGAEGKFVMTLVVKEPVVEIKEHFPEVIPEGYVKVEFKEGAHGKLEGTTKFLVKDGSAKTILNAPRVTANKNWKVNAEKPWDPAIPETFTGTEENKKSFVFTAQYTYTGPDVVEEEPGKGKPDVPDNFVKVEFKKGEHGVISSEEKFAFWVNPEKEVTLTAPTVTPSHGYKHTGWNPEVKAKTKYTEAKEFVAQYKATVLTEDPNDAEHYAKVDFAAGDQGKFEQVGGKDQVTTFWVWKGEKVSLNAPKVTANENYKFKEWDKPIQETYDADTTHTATYESTLNISDTEVKGYQEVKFVAGNDGNFGKDNEQKLIKEKSVWVKPDTLVDLTDKAPTVTVTTEGKSFIGWDQKLFGKFAKADQPTVINAKYDDTVKTTEPDPKFKDKYAKIDFVAGNLGTIENNQTTTFWVVKGEKVTDTFKAPTVTAKKGWKVKAEKPWDPVVATKYAKDTIHVAQYDYVGASVVPEEPGKDKPLVPDNFVKVEFKKGDHGVISSAETFIYWVDPTKEVKLTAPKVIADTNYKLDGWKNGEVVVDLTKANKFEKTTDIVAQYKSTVVTEDPNDENYVTVEFRAGEHGTLTGDAKFWVYKNEKVSITAPTVTAKAGYTFNKWDPEVKDSYAAATVHNATYTTNNNVSDTEVEGYNKVTFKAGAHGTLTEKSVWVKPDTLVDLNDKAPEVTPAEGYSHIGWKPALVGKFENNTDIFAQYSNNISDTPVEGWTELTFDQGDHGKFAKGAKNVKWVNPKADLKLKDIAPAIVADTNYSFDGWKDGQNKADLDKVQKFETAKTFTASYVSDISDNEDTTKVKVTFKPGKYGKFKGTAQEKSVWIKAGKDVDLRDKAPTVIPNQGYGHDGWKVGKTFIDITKVNVSSETVITASYATGSFDKENIDKLIVLGPEKASYKEGEPLDLTGLKVEAIDKQGIRQTYTYKDGKLLDNNDPANELVATLKISDENIKFKSENNSVKVNTKLERSKHNGMPITVEYNNVGYDTIVKLTVLENKTDTPTEVVAANQGDDDHTKVRFKAVQPAEIKIYKAGDANKTNLIVGTPVQGTGDDVGYLIATLNTKLDEGTWIEITAKEANKLESVPEQAQVIRDKNSKWEADTGSKLSTPVIDPIREKDEKVVVEAPKADDKIQTITVEDQKGKTVTLTKDPADKDGKTWIVAGSDPAVKVVENNDGKLEIPVKGKLPINDRDEIKVTFKDGENPANEAFDRAFVKKASQTPTVDPVYTGEKEVKIVDPTVADPTAKTLKVKVGENDTMVIEKQADNSWKVKNNPNANVVVKDGKVIVPLEDKAKKDDIIMVSTINDSKIESPAAEVRVVDKELTEKPTIKDADKDTNFVTGTAAPGAKVTITVTPKKGEPKTFIGEAGKDGNYKVVTDTLVDGDKVVAKASEPGKADNTSDEKTVGVKTSELQKSIEKAEDPTIGGKDGVNLDDKKPIDKELKDALEKGKDVKAKGDAGDPNTDQKAVDKAKEDLDKAIAQKEADTAVDKAKDDPSPENIKDAQDKIDAIPGTVNDNPIKKELQDKLDLIKKIKEAEDRLKQDDVTGENDTPKKPQEDIDKLKKAIQDGKDALNKEEKDKYGEKTTEIEKAITILNQERLNVTFKAVSFGSKTLFLRTSVPGARITVSINGKIITKSKVRNKEGKLVDVNYVTTDGFGAYTLYFGNIKEDGHDFTGGLSENDEIIVEATKDGYNPGVYTETIY